jgi:hypothetical protein
MDFAKRLADKITMRVLGAQGAPRPTVLTPEKSQGARARANMSQVCSRACSTSPPADAQLELVAARVGTYAVGMIEGGRQPQQMSLRLRLREIMR